MYIRLPAKDFEIHEGSSPETVVTNHSWSLPEAGRYLVSAIDCSIGAKDGRRRRNTNHSRIGDKRKLDRVVRQKAKRSRGSWPQSSWAVSGMFRRCGSVEAWKQTTISGWPTSSRAVFVHAVRSSFEACRDTARTLRHRSMLDGGFISLAWPSKFLNSTGFSLALAYAGQDYLDVSNIPLTWL